MRLTCVGQILPTPSLALLVVPRRSNMSVDREDGRSSTMRRYTPELALAWLQEKTQTSSEEDFRRAVLSQYQQYLDIQ